MSGAPALLLPLEGQRISIIAGAAGGEMTVTRRADGSVIGSLLVEERDGVLFIEQLCIEPSARGYGAGSEAAHLVLDAAAEAGYQIAQAWAPADLGLAVYFWFRMGLRPLHGEGPNGGLLLERRFGRA
jgi:hypothetical protein